MGAEKTWTSLCIHTLSAKPLLQHMGAEKTQTSLCIHTLSPKPPLQHIQSRGTDKEADQAYQFRKKSFMNTIRVLNTLDPDKAS